MTIDDAKRNLKRELLDGARIDVEDGTHLQLIDGLVHQLNDFDGESLDVLDVEELDEILTKLAQGISEAENKKQRISEYLNS